MGEPAAFRRVGRYVLHEEIGSGGMAAVHAGALAGEGGFARAVAIKRLRPAYAEDAELSPMLLDEARVAARVRHANVVAVVDLVVEEREAFLVMEYIDGETLAGLLQACAARSEKIPVDVASAVVADVLEGLHAAHEAKDEQGASLGVVHRDVSPGNVLVGCDGIARVVDFGVAKAERKIVATRTGELKGTLAYMAPEQLRGREVDRRCDVYAAGVVLWEALAGRRMFEGATETAIIEEALIGCSFPASRWTPELPEAVDDVLRRALDVEPSKRFATTREMARALRDAAPPAARSTVAEWVTRHAGEAVQARRERAERAERAAMDLLHREAQRVDVRSARPARRRFAVPAAIAVAASLAALALAYRHLETVRATTATDTGAIVPASPAPLPAPPGTYAVTRASGSAAAAPLPSSESAAAPASLPAPAQRATRPRPAARTAPRKNDPCTIPVVVDANGRKTYKRECL